jgi:purine nucleoside permease
MAKAGCFPCAWLLVGLLAAFSAHAQNATPTASAPAVVSTAGTNAPIRVKVVVVAMFERGEDSGDVPGEYQFWVEREKLDNVIPMAAGYHHVRMNKDGVLAMLTGVGTAKAAASVMAVGLDARFDFSKAYWIVAGIGGGDPNDVSLGSAVWVQHVVDGDLAYEIDARQIPQTWSTGFVPLRRGSPYELPVDDGYGESYTLNASLADWAVSLTKDVALGDSENIQKSRARFAGFPNAVKPPFVTCGDELSSSTFWHGSKMEDWANAWTRYYTNGKGNYVVTGMEDSGTMQSLTFLANAGRVDLRRVMVLRTISNFDREPRQRRSRKLAEHGGRKLLGVHGVAERSVCSGGSHSARHHRALAGKGSGRSERAAVAFVPAQLIPELSGNV